MFIKKSDHHFAMFSRLEVERFLYLIKALGVGIRLDWGRQISAHVFINRTQSSLSFMRLEWRGNSRLAVESSPFKTYFFVAESWKILRMSRGAMPYFQSVCKMEGAEGHQLHLPSFTMVRGNEQTYGQVPVGNQPEVRFGLSKVPAWLIWILFPPAISSFVCRHESPNQGTSLLFLRQ